MSIGEELKTELEQFGKETERKDKEKDKEEKAKKKSKGVGDKRIRIFWFASRFRDDNDKVLITEDRVINAIESHVTVESWGYIIHDNCVITQFDKEEDDELWGEIGDQKPRHIHVVVQLKYAMTVNQIAKWFGLPNHMIRFSDKKGRRDAFMDNIAYLTHEFEPDYKGKHIYPRSKVKLGGLRVNIYDEIDNAMERKEERSKYYVKKEKINDVVEDVRHRGKMLRDAEKELGSSIFLDNLKKLKMARQYYVTYEQPMPAMRTIFYVDSMNKNSRTQGKGGMGKTVCTHALAKQFSKEYGADVTKSYDDLVTQGYIYDVGNENVALQNYDGQPILVINEATGYSLIKAFGREGTKELLDRFPTRKEVNKKYGSTIVTAKYIIINGIERYQTFIESLAGIYGDMKVEDKDLNQYYRRFFSHITLVDEQYMDIFFNKGLLDDTQEYNEYYCIRKVYAPFGKMIKEFDNVVLADAEGKILEPIVQKQSLLEGRIGNKKDTEHPDSKRLLERIEKNKELQVEEDTTDVDVWHKLNPDIEKDEALKGFF